MWQSIRLPQVHDDVLVSRRPLALCCGAAAGRNGASLPIRACSRLHVGACASSCGRCTCTARLCAIVCSRATRAVHAVHASKRTAPHRAAPHCCCTQLPGLPEQEQCTGSPRTAPSAPQPAEPDAPRIAPSNLPGSHLSWPWLPWPPAWLRPGQDPFHAHRGGPTTAHACKHYWAQGRQGADRTSPINQRSHAGRARCPSVKSNQRQRRPGKTTSRVEGH